MFLGELASNEIGFLKAIGYINPNTLKRYNVVKLDRYSLSSGQKH
tara:strand:+ start:635 stop:769 length:135 start_codon:yes stop_codon:yes gene_type:complete